MYRLQIMMCIKHHLIFVKIIIILPVQGIYYQIIKIYICIHSLCFILVIAYINMKE